MPTGKKTYIFYSLLGVLVLVKLLVFLGMVKTVTNEDQYEHRESLHDNKAYFQSTDDGLQTPAAWIIPEVPRRLQNADQHDPGLIDHIRTNWIIPPSGRRLQLAADIYTVKKHDDFSQFGQPKMILDSLGNRRGGFYVECGASDGQQHSNSLYLELFYNWTGLLIEPNTEFFAALLHKNRHAYMVNACLSPTNTPLLLNFTAAGVGGGISHLIPENQLAMKRIRNTESVKIQCFPLYSILAAIGVTHVGYFSLDIEGAEVDVLRTVPFDHVTIDTISVEKRVIDDLAATEKKQKEIEKILIPHGFKVQGELRLDVILSRV